MNFKKRAHSFLVFFFILSSAVWARNIAGNFSFIKGDVQISTDNTMWKGVAGGDNFYVLDYIKTGEDSKAELLFSNGNILWVSPFSSLVIKENAESNEKGFLKTKLRLFFGKATASVEKLFGQESGYQMETEVAVAAVKGTKYYMDFNFDTKDSEIGVFDGIVEVMNNAGLKVDVEKDKYLTVGSTGKISDKKDLEENKKAAQSDLEKEVIEIINKDFKVLGEQILASLITAQKKLTEYYDLGKLNSLKADTIDLITPQFTLLKDKLNEENKNLFSKITDAFDKIIKVIPPSRPEDLEAVMMQDGSVGLMWLSSTDLDMAGYKIIRNNEEYRQSNKAEYIDTNVESGETYTYQVYAFDKENNKSSLSKKISITAIKGELLPPQNINANLNLEKAEIKITFTPSLSLETIGYNIYRNDFLLGTINKPEFIDKIDTKIEPGDIVSYTIKSKDIKGRLGDESESIDVSIPADRPEFGSVYLNNSVLDKTLTEIKLLGDDLYAGKIQISGALSKSTFAIKSVFASLDDGKTWQLADGTTSWQYSFVPVVNQEYKIYLKATDLIGNEALYESNVAIIYLGGSREELAKKFISNLQNNYNLGSISAVMTTVSFDYTGDASELRSEIENTWSEYEKVSLSNFVINSLRKEENRIIAGCSWVRSYMIEGYNGSQSGNTDIYLIWEDANWKLEKLVGDKLFGINSSGPASFSITSPQNNSVIYTTNSLTITWDFAKDTGFGISGYDIYIDDYLKDTVNNTYNSYYTGTLDDGTHSVYITAKDFKGNEKRSSNTVSFLLDIHPPAPPSL